MKNEFLHVLKNKFRMKVIIIKEYKDSRISPQSLAGFCKHSRWDVKIFSMGNAHPEIPSRSEQRMKEL